MVRALELKTGRVRWETKVGPETGQYFFHGDPLVAGDTIVVGADAATGGNIHAFDRTTGRELWRHAAGRGVTGPIAGLNGRIYAAQSSEGLLVSLALDSGQLRWSAPINLPSYEGGGAAVIGERVFAGDVSGSLHAIDAATGKDVWVVRLGAPVSTSVSVADGDLYVGTANGTVVRVATDRGGVAGSLKVHDTWRPASVPVVAGDSLFVLLADPSADYRALVSIDRALTRVQWQVTADPKWLTSRVFLSGELIVLGTPAGEVTAYCSKSGAKVWSRSINGRVRSIGGADAVLLIGTQTGDLYGFNAPASCAAR